MRVVVWLWAVALLLLLQACGLMEARVHGIVASHYKRALQQWNPAAAAGLFNVTLPSGTSSTPDTAPDAGMQIDISAVALMECPPGLGFDPRDEGNYTAARMQAEFRRLLKKAWLPYNGNVTLTLESWAVKFRLNVTQAIVNGSSSTWQSDSSSSSSSSSPSQSGPPTMPPMEMCGQSSLVRLAEVRSACNNVSAPLNISVTCSMDAAAPVGGQWGSCSTTPGRMYVTVWFPDDCNLEAMTAVLPQIVDAFAANHTDSMCTRSHQDMNIAMQARARYSFAVASSMDPGTAGELCNAVGTQTANALSTMIEGSMAWPSVTQSALMANPSCTMNGASPPRSGSSPPSSSNNNVSIIVGVVVGVVCSALVLGGMVVGYQAYKRQRTDDPTKPAADSTAAGAPGGGPPGAGAPPSGPGGLQAAPGAGVAAADIQSRDKEAESLNKSYKALQMAAILSGAASSAEPQKYSAAAARKARLKAQRAAEQAAAQPQGRPAPAAGGLMSSFFSSSSGSFFSWSSTNTAHTGSTGGLGTAANSSTGTLPPQALMAQQSQGPLMQQTQRMAQQEQLQVGQMQAAQMQAAQMQAEQMQAAQMQAAQMQAAQMQAAQMQAARVQAAQMQAAQMQAAQMQAAQVQAAQMQAAQMPATQMQLAQVQAPHMQVAPQALQLAAMQAGVYMAPQQTTAQAGAMGFRGATPAVPPLQLQTSLSAGVHAHAAGPSMQPQAQMQPAGAVLNSARSLTAQAAAPAASAAAVAATGVAGNPGMAGTPAAANGSKAAAASAAPVYRHAQTVTTAGPVIPQQATNSDSATTAAASPAAESPPASGPASAAPAPPIPAAAVAAAAATVAASKAPVLDLGGPSPQPPPLSARGSNATAVLDLGVVPPATNPAGRQVKSISDGSSSWGTVAQGHAPQGQAMHGQVQGQAAMGQGQMASYGQVVYGQAADSSMWPGQRTSFTLGTLTTTGHQLQATSGFTALSAPSQGRSSGSQEMSPTVGGHGHNGSRQSASLSDANAPASIRSMPAGPWAGQGQAAAVSAGSHEPVSSGGSQAAVVPAALRGFGSYGHVPAATGGSESPVSFEGSQGHLASGGSDHAPTEGSHGHVASVGSHGNAHASMGGMMGVGQHQAPQPQSTHVTGSQGTTPLGPYASTPGSPFSPPTMELLEFLSEEPAPVPVPGPGRAPGLAPGDASMMARAASMPRPPLPLQSQQLLLQQQLYANPGTPDVADILDMLEGPDPLPLNEPNMHMGATAVGAHAPSRGAADYRGDAQGSVPQLLRAPDPSEMQEIMAMLDGEEDSVLGFGGGVNGYPGTAPGMGMMGAQGVGGVFAMQQQQQQQMAAFGLAAARAPASDEERKLYQDWVAEESVGAHHAGMQSYSALQQQAQMQQWQQLPPAAMAELLKRQQLLLQQQQMQLQQQQRQLQMNPQQHW